MRLIKCLVATVLVMGMQISYADGLPSQQNLNKIIFQTAVEGWVPIWTARVSVEYRASVNEEQLSKLHDNLMPQLSKIISVGKWNVVNFERTNGDSGLENVRVVAITRVPFSELTNLKEKAQAISVPGQTFNLMSVEYFPTLADKEKARQALRDQIYGLARAEAERVNKILPSKEYFVYEVEFEPFLNTPTFETNTMMVKRDVQPQTSVSELLTVIAKVTLAAPTDADNTSFNLPANYSQTEENEVVLKQ